MDYTMSLRGLRVFTMCQGAQRKMQNVQRMELLNQSCAAEGRHGASCHQLHSAADLLDLPLSQL